jgi:class 3 adenylate cyclase/CRP-like cAMP-binding protein/tetratricopeptide (TPR) repeat protein
VTEDGAADQAIVCGSCGRQNPGSASFCGQCGTPLGMTCSSCGAQIPAGARFCPSCGTAVAGAPVVPEELEERKVVTVLFADLTASTELAARLDPEDLRRVLRPFFEAMVEEIERFGGTVEKFIGDAVVAVFGAPVAHEDDPERAVRAGLAMHRRLEGVNRDLQRPADMKLAMRIGINTGEVVTATGVDRDALVTGEPVNIAARFEALAQPGGIVVGERTHRDARRVFSYRSLGEVEVKGIARRLPAWEVTGEAAEGDSDHGPTVLAPMVGRDEELALLDVLFGRAAREERPGLVTVVGPAGIGKSRLAHEFGDRVQRGGAAQVVRGRCLPYGEGLTYWPLAEILKADAGILDSDPAGAIMEKARARLDARWAEDERRAGTTEVLLSSIGVAVSPDPLAGLDGGAAKEATARAWRLYLEARCAERPMVAILEDLHWADASMLDLVEHLAARVGGPLFLVAMTRPDLIERRPTWGGGLRSSATIGLEPLTANDVEHLLRYLLQGLPAPAEVTGPVLTRAEGNPFFAQELVRMLIEGGTLVRSNGSWSLERPLPPDLPDTVQGVIASRIDMLPPVEKRILQDAAVVGRVFWKGAVEGIEGTATSSGTGPVLDALIERGLVWERPASSVAGDRELIFNHILTRDVAYASIPRSRRAEAHGHVLAWCEATMHGRFEEFAEILAYHAELAGDAEGTARYSMLAGHRSRRVFAAKEAIAWYDRAWEAAHRAGLESDPLLAETTLARGGAYEQLGRFAEAEVDYVTAKEQAVRAGDRQLEAQALAARAHVFWLLDRFEEGTAVQAEALELARSIGDHELLARLLYTAGTLSFGRGRYEEALGMHQEGLAVSTAAGDLTGEAFARHGLCETLYFIGPLEEALEEGRRSDRMFRDLGQRPMVYHNLYMVAWLIWIQGDIEPALAAARESVEGNRELGNRRDEGFALGGTAQVLITLAELAEAQRYISRAVAIAQEIRTPRLEVAGRGFLMMIAAELGRFEAIQEEADACFAISDAMGSNFFRPRIVALLGLLVLQQGDADTARRHFAEAVRETGGVLLDDLFCHHLALMGWDQAGVEEDLRTTATTLLKLARGESPLFEAWGRYGLAAADLLAGRAEPALQAAVDIAEEARGRKDRMLEWRAFRVAWKAAAGLHRWWDALSFRTLAGERLREIAGLTESGLDRDSFLARPDVAEVLADAGSHDDGSILDGLSAEDVRALRKEGQVRDLEDGTRIFAAGDAGNDVFVVDAGSVRVVVPGGAGDEPSTLALGPGQVFGEIALLDEGPRAADVVADGPARVVAIPRVPFLRVLEGRPDLAERLVALLRDRLESTYRSADPAAVGDLPARLAQAVQRLAEREGRAGSTVEVLPVFLRDGCVWYLRPLEEASWLVPGSASAHPGAAAVAALASVGLTPTAVHSTSWRHENGRLVLTYLAVLDDPGDPPDGLRAEPTQRASLARGTAVGPPPAIAIDAVVEHALRHLSWLLADDPAVRQVLGSDWAMALAAFQPEPFRALG